MYILQLVKEMTSASSVPEAGQSKPVLWGNAEGWVGREGGNGVQDKSTCTPITDSCCMAKTTTILYNNQPLLK